MAIDKKVENCRENYEGYYTQLLSTGCSEIAAIERCAHRFLDGKPPIKRLSHAKRCAAFWACDFWQNVPANCFEKEAVVLALARSLSCHNPEPDILERILKTAPESLKRGIRYSQLFLLPESTLWDAVLRLSSTADDDFNLFIDICGSIRLEHDNLKKAVEDLQVQVSELSVLETLIYSSLFTFQNVIPEHCTIPEMGEETINCEQEVWDAMNQILAWKLRSRPDSDFKVTEQILAGSLKQHIAPFIFPSKLPTATCTSNLELFSKLIVSQLRFNDFASETIAEFCFNDNYRYRLEGDSVTLYSVEIFDESNWDRNSRKLESLHRYWFNRALIGTHLSDDLYQPFGTPENDHSNRYAYIKASQVFLQLVEVYGMDTKIDLSNGGNVDLFKAIHSLSLMTSFFNNAFIDPFKAFYNDSDNWAKTLHQLAIDGIRNNMQNRFPLTWAEHEEKAQSIKSWTVSKHHPQGDIVQARAILAFWRNDLQELAENLKRTPNIPVPEFHEKPILKLGQYGFQLPWLTAAQNNSTAAINNLRRLGSRRQARGEETRRIEHRLGEQLKVKGFSVVHGYRPEMRSVEDPGEVDLICFLEGQLFILEVKSTYLRKTQQEAWLHRTNTLRKAGQQLKRKVEAVTSAVKKDKALQDKLHISNHTDIIDVHAWIVDTSIEYDQEMIDGFLKVSLEALLVILRNEQHLLRELPLKSIITTEDKDFSGFSDLFKQYEDDNKRQDNLFPHGFTARRFAQIVEAGEVWNILDEDEEEEES